MSIRFLSDKINFTLARKGKLKAWIVSVIRKEKKNPGQIHFIFCDDKFLLKLNKNFLKHETLTDIITFDYSEDKTINGEIYVSVQRVKENAKKFSVKFEDELQRVMIHGVLHLCGYKDKTKKDKAEMRKMENVCLTKFN